MRGIVISALIFALAFPVLPAFGAKNKKAKKDPAAKFDKLDKDNDGQLSKAEFIGKKKDKQDKGKGKPKAKKGKGKKKDPGNDGKKKKGDKKKKGEKKGKAKKKPAA